MEATRARVTTAELDHSYRFGVRTRRAGRDVALRRLLGTGDAAAVLLSLIIMLAAAPKHVGGRQLLWGLAAVPLMVVMFKLYGLYDRDVKRISYSTVDDLPRLFHATVIGGLILWLYARYTPMGRLDFLEITLFGVNVIVLVTCARLILRSLAGRVIGPEKALVVGSGEMVRTLLGKLASHPEYRLDVIGSLGTAWTGEEVQSSGLPVLGQLDDLERVAERDDVSRVLLAVRDIDERELERLLRRCRELSLKVSVIPKLSDVLGPAVEIDDVEGVTVLGLNPPYLPRSSRMLKRSSDIVIATVLLTVLSPILVLVALAVKLTSVGQVLFVQERVGRAGRRFRLFKFRTMVADAEEQRATLLDQSADPNWLSLDHDPRITPLGRFLRRWSIDELPQLWNVLRGEMSMVGPRPLIPAEDAMVAAWARRRLDLTPGITGYWQVLGRTRIPFEEMVKLDYLYVINWSLWEDARLMLRTLPAVLGGRGAN